MAPRPRPPGRRRGDRPRRVLLRRLPPRGRARALLADHGGGRALRPPRRARARHLQRLPGAVRGGAAARRAAAEHVAAVRLPPGRRSTSSTRGRSGRRRARPATSCRSPPSTRPAASGRPTRCSTSSRRTGRSCCATRAAGFNGSARDIAGVSNAAGNVVGLMPHPEHAVDPLTGSADGLRLFESAALVACSGWTPMSVSARVRMTRGASAELGLTDAEYERIVALMEREPNEVELAMFSLMWSEHCGYKHSRKLLKTLPDRGPARRHGAGRERRRGRRRRRAGVRVQGRVAQPPERGRAVRGRGDRRRRHPARRVRGRRAADRDARLAALRRAGRSRPARATCSSARSPASATTATRSAWRRSGARSTSSPPTSRTASSTRCASG